MNLHEVYSDLMGEMSKLDWKRDALLHKGYWCIENLKQLDLTANEVAVRFLSRNRTLKPMAVDEPIFEECMRDIQSLG